MGEPSSRSETSDEPATESSVSPDESPEHGDTQQSHLHTVFVNVTGVEEWVDEQEETQMSRHADADTTSVSTAVNAVADDDGLMNTIDGSQPAENER